MTANPTGEKELRAHIQKITSKFGLAAAFHGINKKNPVPPDPTDAIMTLIADHTRYVIGEDEPNNSSTFREADTKNELRNEQRRRAGLPEQEEQ